MARIRTIKPEFWESETLAVLSLEARLLFIACLNAADDEGLLRWNPSFLKSFAFVYDEGIFTEQITEWMDEIVKAELVLPYKGKVNKGSKQVWYGWIIGFHEHQRINRPSPSKYPAPSLQSSDVKAAYAKRDKWVCQISGKPIESLSERHRGDKSCLSLDHIQPKSKGGTDYPSNIRAAIQSANKGRGNRDDENNPDGEMSESVNDSVNESDPEGKGKEQGKETRFLFDKWYASYPNKKDKGHAKKTWEKIKPDRDLTAKMIRAVRAQKRWRAAMTKAGEFVPPWKNPGTWLNGECWTDELDWPAEKERVKGEPVMESFD